MVRNQLPAQVVNLLHWNDVPRTSRTFCPKNCNIFSVLSISNYFVAIFNYNYIYNCIITQAKQIINFLLLSSDVVPTSSKRKRRIILYGSVARYNPQSVASAIG